MRVEEPKPTTTRLSRVRVRLLRPQSIQSLCRTGHTRPTVPPSLLKRNIVHIMIRFLHTSHSSSQHLIIFPQGIRTQIGTQSGKARSTRCRKRSKSSARPSCRSHSRRHSSTAHSCYRWPTRRRKEHSHQITRPQVHQADAN